MKKASMVQITVLIVAVAATISSSPSAKRQHGDKGMSITGLPFCVLVLRVFTSDFYPRVRVHVLMEPDKITESNLRLLFEKISEQHPTTSSLDAMVYTDVEQLGVLATRRALSNSKGTESQLAYYRRDDRVELFRYNPDYPKSGLKTVIIRGKE